MSTATLVDMTLEPHARGFLAESGGAVLGGLLGLIASGPLGAQAGALIGASAVPAMERWMARMMPEFQRRGRVMADAAAVTSGMDAETIVACVLDMDDAQPLVARVLDAASRTNSDEILRLLGGILGETAKSRPQRVDEDLMMVDAFTGLTPAHLHIMEQLEQPADPGNPDAVWLASAIGAALGSEVSDVGLRTALGGLVARGLVNTHPTWEQTGYGLSEFGEALLAAARRAYSPRVNEQ